LLLGGVAVAGALDAADNLMPFYTDIIMKTLKPMPEFKAAFMAMPQEKRTMKMKECQCARRFVILQVRCESCPSRLE
jgi:hypothetical protein